MKMKSQAWVLVLCLGLALVDRGAAEMNSTDIVETIMAPYDKRIGPDQITGSPTVMDIGIYVLEMHSISDDNMEYSTTIYFRRIWRDPRLDFQHLSNMTELVVRNEFVSEIWVPDIFFTNEREANFHIITEPNTAVWLGSDGTIFLSSRYSLILGCPMDLQKYPLDTQYCKIEMECYSYSTDSLRMRWRNHQPLELPEKLYLQSFTLADHELENCANVYSSGGFPCLRAVFKLERNYGYHLITTYIPSAFIVTVSWVGFWIAPDAVPGRVTLGVTTVLTIITQSFIGGLSMPQVPYVKAVDVWLAMTMTFVFASLIEFALVNVVLRAEQKKALRRQAELAKKRQEQETLEGDRQGVLYQIATYLAEMNPHEKGSIADKIDFCSRFCFPTGYIIFAIIYWVYYNQWELSAQNY